MAAKSTKPKTQKTAKGYEIPVPTRGEVDKALAEIARDAKPLRPKKKLRSENSRGVTSER